MLEIAIALIVGFGLGYGVREWVSRRRRQAERRGRALWGPPPGRHLAEIGIAEKTTLGIPDAGRCLGMRRNAMICDIGAGHR